MLRQILAIAAGVAFTAGTANAGFYCWTNKEGNKECGDRIPPEYSKQDRDVLNKSGQQVRTLPHEKTEAELAEDARQRKLKELEYQNATNDRALLQTYSSVADIERVRNERLNLIDGNIKLSQSSAENSQKRLAELKARKAQDKGDKKSADYVTKQIAEFEKRAATDQKNIDRLRGERQATSAKFERDIARYRQLKGLPPEPATASAADQAANPRVGK